MGRNISDIMGQKALRAKLRSIIPNIFPLNSIPLVKTNCAEDIGSRTLGRPLEEKETVGLGYSL